MANISREQRQSAADFLVQERIYNSNEVEHMSDAELIAEYRLNLDNLDELQAISDPAAKAIMKFGIEHQDDPNVAGGKLHD